MAHAVALETYRLTARFPSDERFGLVSQARRSAVSIALNIEEGTGRDSDRDFRRFLGITTGSANETEYCLLLARDLGYLPADAVARAQESLTRTRSMLTRLRQALASPS